MSIDPLRSGRAFQESNKIRIEVDSDKRNNLSQAAKVNSSQKPIFSGLEKESPHLNPRNSPLISPNVKRKKFSPEIMWVIAIYQYFTAMLEDPEIEEKKLEDPETEEKRKEAETIKRNTKATIAELTWSSELMGKMLVLFENRFGALTPEGAELVEVSEKINKTLALVKCRYAERRFDIEALTLENPVVKECEKRLREATILIDHCLSVSTIREDEDKVT